MKVAGRFAKSDRTDAQILARWRRGSQAERLIPGKAARPLQDILTLTRAADYEETTMKGAAVA